MSTQMTAHQEGRLSHWLTRPETVTRFDQALGGFMTGDAFIAQILIAFQEPEIAECTQQSQFEAAHKCAALGLLPTLDHVALIPRKFSGGKYVDVMPQWQGYKSLMERHPDVLEVNAELVHAATDEYSLVNGEFRHSFDPFDPRRTFKNIKDLKGGYCVVTYRDPVRKPKYHFLTADYIDKCRQCAETQNVWNKWFHQQALKTCYRSCWSRRVVNFDPVIMKRLQELADSEDRVLGNDPNRVEWSGVTNPAALPSIIPPTRTQILVGAVSGATAPSGTSEPQAQTTAAPEASQQGVPAPSENSGPEPQPSNEEHAVQDQAQSEEEVKRQQFMASTERKFQVAKGMAEVDRLKADLVGSESSYDLSPDTRQLVEQWHAEAVKRLNAARKPSGQKQFTQ